jgi:hypothetical protein
MKKTVLYYEFDTTIYPRKIWIAISKTSLDEIFEGSVDLDEKQARATTSWVQYRATGEAGMLIQVARISDLDCEVMTHEAVHAAIEILSDLDVPVNQDNQESIAYFAGWIAKCCEKVRNGKCDESNKIYKD